MSTPKQQVLASDPLAQAYQRRTGLGWEIRGVAGVLGTGTNGRKAWKDAEQRLAAAAATATAGKTGSGEKP